MKANPKLFYQWKNLNDDIRTLAGAVQNDMDFSMEQVREFWGLARDFQSKVARLSEETVDYLREEVLHGQEEKKRDRQPG